jgi:type IV pilus assembly protein PilM
MMSLLERFRPASRAPLPTGAQVGFRWGALARQRRTSVGIDFGAGALKVAQIRWTRQGPRLENYAYVPLPPGVMDDGALREPAEMGDMLRSTLAQMGLQQPVVGACVGGPSVLMRYINLPKVSPEEIRSAMKFEAPQHLPIPEDQLVYDFTPVPEAAGVPEHQMAVFLSGTHKKLIDSFTDTLGRAGLRPSAIELDCLAALRAVEWLGVVSHTSQLPMVLLDFGEMGTRISVMRYGVPMLSRTIPTGLHHLRTAVADTLHVSAAEAEMALRVKGVKGDPELDPAVEPWVTSLMESVGRSIEFFMIQNRGATLERVFLIGGGAAMPSLPEALTSHLQTVLDGRADAGQLRVQPVGLAGLEIQSELLPDVNNIGPMLITALGSALREGAPE